MQGMNKLESSNGFKLIKFYLPVVANLNSSISY